MNKNNWIRFELIKWNVQLLQLAIEWIVSLTGKIILIINSFIYNLAVI